MKKGIQNLHSPKGMRDILPQKQDWWDKVREEIEYIADYYNFSRIDTVLMEKAEVFEKSLGETSDIVSKEMFVFKNTSGDRFVLRPEGTAGIVRAYAQHGLSHLGQPLKLFYSGPFFRREQPQTGRYRQFHQAGFEILGGDSDPVYDAQIILAVYRLLENLKLKNISLHLNSAGCRICRPNYRKNLVNYYKNLAPNLCRDCRQRLKTNPLRLLDCKNENCRQYKENAPIILNNLCVNCSKYFRKVLEFLEELGLPYELDNHLVRGLDYYSKTVFEIFTDWVPESGKKFDFAIAGGGRYDYLMELFGIRQSAGVGGSVGLERVIEVMEAMKLNVGRKQKPRVFFIHIGESAKKKSLKLIEELRGAGISVLESLGKDSLAAQLRSANKAAVSHVLIFGQREAFEDSIIVRDFKNGVQETVVLKKLVNELKKRLK